MDQLEINARYIRTAPNNNQDIVVIKNNTDLTEELSLAAAGFTYKKVSVTVVPDSTCVNCEG